MTWLPSRGTDRTKILHLRLDPNQGWKPYTSFPRYTVPDYLIHNGSKGYATYQVLRNRGWHLIPSSQARSLSSLSSTKQAS